MSDDDTPINGRRRWAAVLLAMLALAAAGVVAVLAYSTISTTATRDDAVGSQQHSYEVMILARDLDATLGGAEATLGRFVISGDKRVGQVYAESWRRASTLLDRLVQESGSGRRAQVEALRAAYLARGQELASVALRTNYGQNDQALSKYYQAGKSETLTRLRQGLDRLIADERATLDARTADADRSIAQSNQLASILAGAGLLLALAAGLLGLTAWSSWRRRRDEEDRNYELEDAVMARTAELEAANAQLVSEMATREETEFKLRQAQKMEVVGQLTGGIAHDFNNMLGVVVGGIELARRRLTAGGSEDAQRHLDRAMEGANRAAALTRRLLTFARAEPLLPAAIEPNALINAMVELLDRTLGDGIAIKIEAGASWPVFIDAHQLENVLLNLAVNARDAMPKGGTLTISTGNTMIDDDAVPHLAGGDYVCISVRDDGIGMAPDVLERAFEPFFTTKPHGQGTGLGLSQTFGFVRQSGGGITIESAPGEGTRISLYLPRHIAEAPAEEELVEAPGTPQRPRRPGCPVLVIEDDLRVLAATCEALTELGYEPLPCSGAVEVPPVLRARRDIGLIVSDVLMPGVTGPELVAAIKVVHPHIPVLFVTGFAGDIDNAAQFGGHEVLRKPFTLAALAAAVERVRGTEDELRAEAA